MVDLNKVGALVVKEIKRQILKMQLVDTGALLSSYNYDIRGGKIFITSTLDYALDIEYGTFELSSSADKDFPKTSDQALSMKKKDMSFTARRSLPRGMIPFAPVRRVLFNKKLMESIFEKSFE
jgi:hypothetical protein